MSREVVGVAGAVVGFIYGGPAGAALGWSIGYGVGAAMFPRVTKQEQPLLHELRITGTEYGQPIPWVQGHFRLAPQIIWASDRRPVPHTTSQEGGKGGGDSVETTTYTYDVDLYFLLTDNPILGVSRIWEEGKLVYTALADSDATSLAASAASEKWDRLTVYTGDADQDADPTYEAAVGTANAPAYRNRGTVFIEGLHLDGGGRIPNFTFEVQTAGNAACTMISAATLPAIAAWAGGATYFAAVDKFVAIGAATVQAYSSDGGATWALGSGATTNNGQIIANSVCALTGYNGGATSRTTDGIVWAAVASTPTFGTQGKRSIGVCPNDSFVILDSSGGIGRCFTSPTGAASSWTQQAAPPSGTGANDIQAIASDGVETVMAVAGRSGGATTAAFRSTDNAVQWSAVTLPLAGAWTDMIWNGRYFFIFPFGQTGLRSATGAEGTWEQFELPSNGQWYMACALNGGSIWINLFGDSNSVFLSEDDGASWVDLALPVSAAWRPIATDGYRFVMLSTSDSDAVYSCGYPEWDLNSETLVNVVTRICRRAGLADSQFDASDLANVTRRVRGLAVSQVMPARNALELLMSAFFFEMTVSDKIYFKVRGGDSAATIPYEDLGAAAPGEANVEALGFEQASELELPAQVSLTYLNEDDDYQVDTQLSDRVLSGGEALAAVQIPLVLTPSEAKQIADVILWDQYASRVRTKVNLLGDYAALEPTDVVTVTDHEGATHRVRLTKRTDAYPLLSFEAVLDDAGVLESQGFTSTDYSISTTVTPPVDTVLALMDIPILRDADDDAGFYAAAAGEDTPWPGAQLLSSPDDVEFDLEETFTESGVLGTCESGGSPSALTALQDWAGGRMFDEHSSVTVDVGPGTLSSTTRAAILADKSVNAALVGDEIIQFRTATLVASGVYTLTGLRRGCRGTEWAMTGHAAGERFVLLRLAGLRRIEMETSRLGVTRYYKGVTLGRRLSTATSEQFANNGVGKKPFAPVHLRIVREANGDITGTFSRRTRLSSRWVGPLGGSVPLGEATEAYQIEIGSGSPSRVLETTSAAFTYTLAQQTEDFGGAAPATTYRVHQMSETVGRGYALEKVA